MLDFERRLSRFEGIAKTLRGGAMILSDFSIGKKESLLAIGLRGGKIIMQSYVYTISLIFEKVNITPIVLWDSTEIVNLLFTPAYFVWFI